jgi:hypothetical protein
MSVAGFFRTPVMIYCPWLDLAVLSRMRGEFGRVPQKKI